MIHQINAQHVARSVPITGMPGSANGGAMASETGEFDFFGYLMGLQTSPMDTLLADTGVTAGTNVKTDGKADSADEKLLSLFDKKQENLSWNPLFPNLNQGMALQNQPIILNNDSGLNRIEDLSSEKQVSLTESMGKEKTATLDRGLVTDSKEAPLKEKGQLDTLNQKDVAQNTVVQKSQRDFAIQKYGSKQEVAKDNGFQVKTQIQETTNQASNFSKPEVSSPLFQQLSNDESSSDVKSRRRGDDSDSTLLVAAGTQFNGEVQSDLVTTLAGNDEVRQTIPEVMQKVESMVHHGGGKMTVSLNPPSLGRIEIEVTARGKNVEIQMKSENSLAKATLESHFTDLKQSMQVQDLNLHKMEVHVNRDWDSSMDGRQFSSFAGQSNQQQESRSFSQDSKGSPWKNEKVTSSKIASVASSQSFGGRASVSGLGRVDIRI